MACGARQRLQRVAVLVTLIGLARRSTSANASANGTSSSNSSNVNKRRACRSGWGKNGNDCRPCPTGTYSADTYSANATSNVTGCALCPVGQHNSEAGRSACSKCGLGTYQSTAGAIDCTVCPDHSSTCYIGVDKKHRCTEGEANVQGCKCTAGYFLQSMNATTGPVCSACPLGGSCCACGRMDSCYTTHDNSINQSLSTCDEDVLFGNYKEYGQACEDCFVGVRSPIPGPGYFEKRGIMLKCEIHRVSLSQVFSSKDEANSQLVSQWNTDSNCRGGPSSRCSAGATGEFCAECEVGWYKDTRARQCFKCTTAPRTARIAITAGFVLLIVLVLPAAVMVLHVLAADLDAGQHMVYLRLMMDHLQLMSVNLNLMGNWPLPVLKLLLVSSASTFDLSYLRLECAFQNFDFVTLYVLKLLSPFGIVGVLLCYDALIWTLYRAAVGLKRRRSRRDLSGLASSPVPKQTASDDDSLDAEQDGDSNADPTSPTPRDGEELVGTAMVKRIHRLRGLGPLFQKIPNIPDSAEAWADFTYVQTQVMLTLLMWLYISVVDATVAVFDCTEFADGRSYLLIHQSVECAWIGNRDYESNGSSAWSHLVLSALPPLMAFVLGLPALFVVIFVRNMDNAQMGEITTLKKYGFLFKTYSRDGFYFELVVLLRKAVIVTISRVGRIDPFLQGVLSLVAYFGFISWHAHVQPYRLEKHNSMGVYLLSANALVVLSSLLFLSQNVSSGVRVFVTYLNVAVLLYGWGRAIVACLIDLWVYLNLTLFLSKMEELGFVDSTARLRSHYEQVDKNGLVDKPMVDILVTRNRFVHTVSRPVAGEVDGKREVSHEEANQALDDFHDRLGDFVRRINQEGALARANSRRASNSAMFENPVSDLVVSDDEDADDKDAKQGSEDDAGMPRNLMHLEERAELLKKMYTEKNLAYVVLFLEHEYRAECGPGQLMHELLQFEQQLVSSCAVNLAQPSAPDEEEGALLGLLERCGVQDAGTVVDELEEEHGIKTVSQFCSANLDSQSICAILSLDENPALHAKLREECAAANPSPLDEEARAACLAKGRKLLLEPDMLLGLRLRSAPRSKLHRMLKARQSRVQL